MFQQLISIKQQTVNISGSWVKTKPADWVGIAHSNQPIVAVSFLKYQNEISWCKSDREQIDGQQLRLLLGWYDNFGFDVQVNFGVGSHVISRTLLPEPTYLPSILSVASCVTGSMFKFTLVEGSPPIECWALFLDRSDVKMGRHGLWHLRRELSTNIFEPLKSILSYGRTGAVKVV